MKTLLLYLAAIITVGSAFPYIRDILRGTTKPSVVSWLTWTILTGTATVAEFAAGEFTTAIFTLAAAIATGFIVILALRYGYTKYTKFDVICQIGAIIGLLLWWIFNSPTVAIIAIVSIDLIAALPTIRHSWISPKQETPSAFAIASGAAILALLALSTFNWASLAYPVYLILANAVITGILLIRRNQITRKSE